MKRLATACLFAALLLPNDASADEPNPLAGVWFQHIKTTSIAKLPVVGEVSSVSNFYAVTKLQQNGGSLTLETTPCFVQIDGEMKRVKTIVPQAMTNVMGPGRRSGTVDGNRVRFGRAVDVLGAELKNEWKDPLPEEPDDPAVIDEDGDGKPGVTVKISGPIDGQIYVVQRAWNALDGSVNSDRTQIDGTVTWESSQNVLDSTSMFLKANPESWPAKGKGKNTFSMRPASEKATCDDLRSRYVRLFSEK